MILRSTMILRPTLTASLLVLLLSACGGGPSGEQAAELQALEARVAALEQRKERIEDVNAIERLQHAYGYYADRGLWDEVADLFADDGTIEIGLDGVYVGRERVRQYLRALSGGRQALTDGELGEHLQVMVITLAPDGARRARWRAIVLERARRRRSGGSLTRTSTSRTWRPKVKALHWYQALFVPYEGGWQTKPDANGAKYVSGTLPPDRPPSVEYKTWPDTYLPPFSFPNPVGKYVGTQ
jgi:hypothetical protein